MVLVNDTLPEPSTARRAWNPATLGTSCCILSAFCYTGANICLRQLASLEIDPAWVICLKEGVTVVVVGPWLVIQWARGRRWSFPTGALWALVAAGVVVQLAGNLPAQWAFGVVGLAVSMPAMFGVMLTASALIGLFLLGERLTPRSVAAVLLLVGSIALLCAGSATAGAEPAVAVPHPGRAFLGIGAACLAGAMYAALGATIRHTSRLAVPPTVTVFVVTAMGVLSLGAVSWIHLGPQQLLATGRYELAWMLAAGVFNLVAFLLITKGLQLTTLVHANVLNASQVAVGAVAGILLFAEPGGVWVMWGIGLTVMGTILIGHPPDEEQAMETV